MTDKQSTPNTAAADAASQKDVGTLLRANRESAGIDIADAARALRISQKYLQALEDSRYADLPGAAYAIGFVRSYAEYLHLDGEEITRRYKDEASGINGKSALVFPKPIPDGGVPGGAVLGIGVLLAVAAYAAWYWNFNKDDVEIVRVESVPEYMAGQSETAPSATSEPEPDGPAGTETVQVTSPEEASADAEAPDVVADADVVKPAQEIVEPAVEQAEAASQDAAESVEATAQSQAVAEATPQPQPKTPNTEMPNAETTRVETPEETQVESAPDVAAPEAVTPEVDTPAVAAPETEAPQAVTQQVAEAPVEVATTERQNDGPSRITVRAKSNSWIQVRDEIADRLLFTRLLREGDEYEVPNRGGLRLMTGNAGALELLVDGTVVPPIGTVGEVRRDVELDADKLKSGSAVSE